jgi:hypothetical protein
MGGAKRYPSSTPPEGDGFSRRTQPILRTHCPTGESVAFPHLASLVAAFFPVEDRMREKSNFALWFKLIWVVQSAREIFPFRFFRNWCILAASRLDQRGARDRHERWSGMRWTRHGQALLRKTTGDAADGEIVWSWRPDAGAKVAGLNEFVSMRPTTDGG